MGVYSKNIIPINNGYMIKNYSVVDICFRYFLSVLMHLLFLVYISTIIHSIINKEFIAVMFSTIFTIVFYIIYFIGVNDIKKIVIDNKVNKIIFKYRLIPFIKIKEIDFDKIENISINYILDTIPYFPQFPQVKEKTYSVDLIDKDLYSYTIYQSTLYDEELIDFSNKIGNIINKKVDDNNSIEGYKNIYKKNLI
jgi:hypothetical protein